MSDLSRFHVPGPHWRRTWWRLGRPRPGCFACGRTFRDVHRWEAHWILHHTSGGWPIITPGARPEETGPAPHPTRRRRWLPRLRAAGGAR